MFHIYFEQNLIFSKIKYKKKLMPLTIFYLYATKKNTLLKTKPIVKKKKSSEDHNKIK